MSASKFFDACLAGAVYPHTYPGSSLKADISMRVIQLVELCINSKEHLLRIYTELNNSP